MSTTTTELVSYEDPNIITERVAVAGFLAGDTGNTKLARSERSAAVLDRRSCDAVHEFSVRVLGYVVADAPPFVLERHHFDDAQPVVQPLVTVSCG
jgi:hypothetical protein